MAFSHGSSAKVYLNGYDLTSYFNSVSTEGSGDAVDTTTFGETCHTYIAGVKESSVSLDGLYDATAGASGTVLQTALGADDSELCYFPNGDTLGNAGIGAKGIETKYEINTDVTDANKVSAELLSCVGPEGIVSHHALAARSTSGTSTTVDNLLGSTGSPSAYLQVTAIAGGTVTVKIQDSADDSSYTDLLTFTGVSSAPASERIETSGTVRRYSRAVWTLTGGTATFVTGLGRYSN